MADTTTNPVADASESDAITKKPKKSQPLFPAGAYSAQRDLTIYYEPRLSATNVGLIRAGSELSCDGWTLIHDPEIWVRIGEHRYLFVGFTTNKTRFIKKA